MFAIVRAGGKQYKVKSGDVICVEKMPSYEAGVVLSDVLMVQGDSLHVGDPFLKDVYVTADFVKEIKMPKIIVFKKKRRHNYRRKLGHRQVLAMIKVTDIKGVQDGA